MGVSKIMLHDCISFNEGINGSIMIKMSHLLGFTTAAVFSLMLLL